MQIVWKNQNCFPKVSWRNSLIFLPLNTKTYKNCWILFEFSFKLRSFSNFADHNPSNERMTFFPFGKTLPTQLSVFFESDSNFDSGQNSKERSISKLRFKTFFIERKKLPPFFIFHRLVLYVLVYTQPQIVSEMRKSFWISKSSKFSRWIYTSSLSICKNTFGKYYTFIDFDSFWI